MWRSCQLTPQTCRMHPMHGQVRDGVCYYAEPRGGLIITDQADEEHLFRFTWCLSNGYPTRRVGRTMVRLHREIAVRSGLLEDLDDPRDIDHKNGITLDARRGNLRIANHFENARNLKTRSNNSSGVTGVHFREDCGKWQARITLDKKLVHLGYFKTLEEAKLSRKQAEDAFFGEFVRPYEFR